MSLFIGFDWRLTVRTEIILPLMSYCQSWGVLWYLSTIQGSFCSSFELLLLAVPLSDVPKLFLSRTFIPSSIPVYSFSSSVLAQFPSSFFQMFPSFDKIQISRKNHSSSSIPDRFKLKSESLPVARNDYFPIVQFKCKCDLLVATIKCKCRYLSETFVIIRALKYTFLKYLGIRDTFLSTTCFISHCANI